MMPNAFETIQARKSVRTYEAKPLPPEIITQLQALCQDHVQGPFGTQLRLKLLDLRSLPQEDLRSLGTYGVIKGASLYILAAVKQEPGNMEDLGYCLERVILGATALGLGTCWLAGTLRRISFAQQMNLQDDELLPAITPVGYGAKQASLVDRALRFGAGSNKRKAWNQLFLGADGKTTLSEEDAGAYRDVLEAVRLGPSASNRQPWRIQQAEGGVYRLYLAENPKYNQALGKIRIQNIDMGIAMCHFQAVAEQKSLPGRWTPSTSPQKIESLIHIGDWIPSP